MSGSVGVPSNKARAPKKASTPATTPAIVLAAFDLVGGGGGCAVVGRSGA
jgi:hypothetical protein